ncbi:MAG: RNA-protein complex protein Nop10 [Nitrosopumilus sp.]
MKFQLRKCLECKKFTLKDKCDKCSIGTISAHPAKFSPDDKYLRYRTPENYN